MLCQRLKRWFRRYGSARDRHRLRTLGGKRIADLEAEIAKLRKNSSTSSKPPKARPKAKKKGRRKIGGQPGQRIMPRPKKGVMGTSRFGIVEGTDGIASWARRASIPAHPTTQGGVRVSERKNSSPDLLTRTKTGTTRSVCGLGLDGKVVTLWSHWVEKTPMNGCTKRNPQGISEFQIICAG